MSKKIILLLSLLPLALARPAFADDAPAAPDVAEKPGLMTRFAKLFDGFDTTRPENQHVYVIHTGTPKAAPADSQPQAEAAATATPAASSANVADSQSADAPAPPAKTHGFTLSSGFATSDASKSSGDHPSQ